ncbi:MAG: DUF3775 domain-containing protein [Hyphomicrobiaceae bacterium]
MNDEETPDLHVALEKVCFLIVKAREYDGKDIAADEDSGSNPSDDNVADVLEQHSDDPVQEELTSFINALDDDEQIDLVTLMWLGRGDGSVGEWAELRAQASEAHNERTADYLLGTPLLGDFLGEGLAKMGLSCDDTT